MSQQKTRKPIDAMQRMLTSFKSFEKKLDKLQNDMNFQGETLSDLRLMVLNLSSGVITMPTTLSEDTYRHYRKRSMAIQYEDKYNQLQDMEIPKKSELPRRKTSHLHSQQVKRLSVLESPFQSQLHKIEASQVHLQRHINADALKKANILKTQQLVADKKLGKIKTR